MYWGIYEKRCFGCVKENSADILYREVLQYSLLQHNKVIACIRSFRKWCKMPIFRNKHFKKCNYPILFSWEQKSMFSCWAVKAKPIAVKYVKKYKNFETTTLMSVKENFMVFIIHWGICHALAIQKMRIPRAKSTAIQFILSKKLQKY